MSHWLDLHQDGLAWLGSISLIVFVASLIIVPWLVGRIPQDFFVKAAPRRNYGPLHWFVIFFKNLLGLAFLLAGIAMLVLPGQGILTMVLGITLLDFPAKSRLLRWMVSQPAVYRSLDWLRKKTGSEPLDLPRR